VLGNWEMRVGIYTYTLPKDGWLFSATPLHLCC
jgi:hypothetical protein